MVESSNLTVPRFSFTKSTPALSVERNLKILKPGVSYRSNDSRDFKYRLYGNSFSKELFYFSTISSLKMWRSNALSLSVDALARTTDAEIYRFFLIVHRWAHQDNDWNAETRDGKSRTLGCSRTALELDLSNPEFRTWSMKLEVFR